MTQYRSDDFVINFLWASSGSQMMKQFDYSHQVRRPEGGMTRPLSYGGVMRVAGRWDGISESSVEQDVEHLVRVIDACRQLV
ncbi:hypothetical protein F183_A34950 [Bryobacterales bacterium F-183]|nr:hypothetical protein F183_A34950 [Bryobacterales bacterium F-183]